MFSWWWWHEICKGFNCISNSWGCVCKQHILKYNLQNFLGNRHWKVRPRLCFDAEAPHRYEVGIMVQVLKRKTHLMINHISQLSSASHPMSSDLPRHSSLKCWAQVQRGKDAFNCVCVCGGGGAQKREWKHSSPVSRGRCFLTAYKVWLRMSLLLFGVMVQQSKNGEQ